MNYYGRLDQSVVSDGFLNLLLRLSSLLDWYPLWRRSDGVFNHSFGKAMTVATCQNIEKVFEVHFGSFFYLI
jgi:hypothetical protein